MTAFAMTQVHTLYHYVGPEHLKQLINSDPERVAVRSPQDVRTWMQLTGQTVARSRAVTATYIVDRNGSLYIGDRHMEHVACALGQPVLAAGEITFALHGVTEVTAVTNQSTGYCPEPSSWPHVARSLQGAGLNAPAHFSHAFQFRICERCDSINLIKEEDFQCARCEQPLSRDWNVDNTSLFEVPA